MSVPPGWTDDYVDMLRALIDARVEFLIVGAHDVSEADFERPGTVYQLGLPPNRIDLLTRISGVELDEAWESRVVARIGDLEVSVIGRAPLIRNKRAAGRDKDLVDVRLLERPQGS
jgi:hypothetical protein